MKKVIKWAKKKVKKNALIETAKRLLNLGINVKDISKEQVLLKKEIENLI